MLKINSKDDTCLKVNGRSMKQVDVACYLGDHFNRQGNKSDLCKLSKERVTKAKGTIIELCFLREGMNMGNKQIESMLLALQNCFYTKVDWPIIKCAITAQSAQTAQCTSICPKSAISRI